MKYPIFHFRREQGEKQLQRVLDCLIEGKKTTKQIGAAIDMNVKSVAIYVQRLRASKKVFISGHEPRHGTPAPIYAAGSAPDVEYVPNDRPTPKTSAEERRQQILALLAEQPRTARELADCVHIVGAAVGRYIAELRAPGKKQVYIADWRHPREVAKPGTGGDWAPVYAAGANRDKPKPKRETSSQRNARLRKDPAFRDARNAKRRASYAVQKHSKKKNGIFAALGL